MKKFISVLVLIFIFSIQSLAAPALKVDFVSEREADVSVRNTGGEQYKIGSWYFANGILYVQCVKADIGSSANTVKRIVSPEPIFPAPIIMADSGDKFSDITRYRTEILNLNSRGIINGYPDGSFAGDRTVKRAEIAKMLFVAGDYDKLASGVKFSDVDTHWAKDYVNSLNALGVINGYPDGSFNPEGQVKIGEAIALIDRMFDFYSDVTSTVPNTGEHWSNPNFENLVKKGIIRPEDEIYKNYEPTRGATRYEISLMLSRALNTGGKVK